MTPVKTTTICRFTINYNIGQLPLWPTMAASIFAGYDAAYDAAAAACGQNITQNPEPRAIPAAHIERASLAMDLAWLTCTHRQPYQQQQQAAQPPLCASFRTPLPLCRPYHSIDTRTRLLLSAK